MQTAAKAAVDEPNFVKASFTRGKNVAFLCNVVKFEEEILVKLVMPRQLNSYIHYK